MTREDTPTLLCGLVVVLVVSFIGLRTKADPDLWGHVRFGQDMLSAQAIPREDPYAFTSDRPWMNHEWMSEVLMAVAYNRGGAAGLSTMKFLVTIGVFAAAWRAVRDAGVRQPAAMGLLLAAVLPVNHLVASVRPQLFSLLLLTVLLSLLNAIARGRTRLFYWLPLVFALWANCHGGWIVGAGMVVLWSLCAAVSGTLKWRWAVGGSALAAMGGLFTPYGFELWRFLWETVGLGRDDIVDWQPLYRTPALLIPWALAASLSVAAWMRGGLRALPLLIPPIVLGLLALRVVRLEGFFGMASVILLAPCFAGLGPVRLPLDRRPSRTELTAVGIFSLVALGVMGAAMFHRAGCVGFTSEGHENPWAPEAEAIEFARLNHLEGRLLNYFDYGEMAIWHLAPKLKVSYDGRRETVYSAAVQNAHTRFYLSADDAGYARILNSDYVWLPHRLPVNAALERDGWLVIFKGPKSVMYARTARTYIQPSPMSGRRCFPGP